MQKSLLERFISKYNLSGAAEAVTWTSEKKKLSTKFISEDRHVIGTITTSKIDLEEGDYHIFDTAMLRNLLGVLDEEIKVKINTTNGKNTSLSLSDKSSKVSFVLADKTTIPASATPKNLPTFETKLTLDKSFVERFIRAKSALPDVDTFTAMSKDGSAVNIVLGHSSINTNQISLTTEVVKAEKLEPINFHARYLKDILSANKEAKTGTLEISSAGLARVSFEMDDFDVTYYLPKVDVEE